MKSLVLLSGGVDSSTCLAMALDNKEEVIAISIEYGQSHGKRELQAAKDIANYYKVDHRIIDLSNIFNASKSSLNKNNNLEVSKGEYAEQENINTEVEFRNGVFLSVMASLALQFDANKIYYGAHLDDSGAIYADTSEEFIDSITKTIDIGTRSEVEVVTPFRNKRKEDIVRTGLELNLPYELTYSCYVGGDKPCGECGTCIDRKKAFLANGITDEKYF
jgi:protein ExsB